MESDTLVPIETLPIRPVSSEQNTETLAQYVRTLKSDNLSIRQKTFCYHYQSGKSAKDAALLSGYSESTAEIASVQILRNPKVMKFLQKQIAEKFEQMNFDATKIINHVTNLATANIRDYVEVLPDGGYRVDLTQVDRDQWAAIQELSYDAAGHVKIKLVDTLRATEHLARLKKLIDSDQEKGKQAGLTIQTLDSIIQQFTQVTVNMNTQSPEGQEVQKIIEQNAQLLPADSNESTTIE